RRVTRGTCATERPLDSVLAPPSRRTGDRAAQPAPSSLRKTNRGGLDQVAERSRRHFVRRARESDRWRGGPLPSTPESWVAHVGHRSRLSPASRPPSHTTRPSSRAGRKSGAARLE